MAVTDETAQRLRRALASGRPLDPAKDTAVVPLTTATDAGTTQTLANAIRDLLIDLGIAVDGA